MKRAIILMGLPLAGKTTWIVNNVTNSFHLVSADMIKESHPDYDPENAEVLHEYSVKEAERRVYGIMEKELDIVLDSGSINNTYSIRIINTLKENGYNVKLVHIKTPYEVCLERNRIRTRKVPVAAIHAKAVKENAQFHRLKVIVNEVEVVNYYSNKHMFVDMDGVIASLSTLPIIDGEIDFVNGEVHKHLSPVQVVIDKLRELEKMGHTLYILSAIPNSFSLNEKNDWLDRYFNIKTKHRFFVNQGRHKAEMLENLSTHLKLDKRDMVMVDDIHDTLYKVKERGINSMHISEFLATNF